MFLLYLFVCNCTCECMFCVGDHLVQAVLPFVLPIFGKIDNNNNKKNNNEVDRARLQLALQQFAKENNSSPGDI